MLQVYLLLRGVATGASGQLITRKEKKFTRVQDKNNQVRQLEIYNYFSSDKFLTVFLIEDNYETFSLETKYRWFTVKILLKCIDQWFSTPLGCKLFAKQALSDSYTCIFHWLPTSTSQS